MGDKDEVKVMGGLDPKTLEWMEVHGLQNDMRFIRILRILATLPETNRKLHLKIGPNAPKRKLDRLPTSIFQELS